MRRSDREIAEFKEIEEIIRKADVCRIALANDNMPYMVTLNFGYVAVPKKMLYFHCANEGRKLKMISQNNYVCFEMDIDHQIYKGTSACNFGMKYSSVLGYGNIYIVTDNDERVMGMNSIMDQYGATGMYDYDKNVFEHTTILRLEILEITGKKK
jgi:uncharacterized protein